MVTLKTVLREGAFRLTAAGVTNADREIVWLAAHVLRISAGALRLQGERALSPTEQAALERLVARRVAREPLQYILGSEEFMGLTFRVSPDVLIPRPDTETVVLAAAERLSPTAQVADIGTGSGAIAIALAHMLPGLRLSAVDLSPQALAVARENAQENGVADRIHFYCGDLLEPLANARFDAILSNPPYVAADELPTLMPEVRDWEPRLALTPGPDALALFRRLASQAPLHLNPAGFLGVEVGAGQAPLVAALFVQAGLMVTIYRDGAGIERAVFGSRT